MIPVKVCDTSTSKTLLFDPLKTLTQNLFVSGYLSGVPLCAGIGTCGQCALIFIHKPPIPAPKDLEYFDAEELNSGFRLGCVHYPESNQCVQLTARPSERDFSFVSDASVNSLGIDIGTTSIKWSFKHSDSSFSYGQTFNPQMGAGPEVMSRLTFASACTENKDLLHDVLYNEILNVINLQADTSLNICIAGNPAMIFFLLKKNLAGLSVAPYSLEYYGGQYEVIGSYDSEVYVPSLFSPFVGADASAGLTYLLEAYQPDFPFLFADFGTNGEIVLGISPEKFLCTSIALGPALEGIGLRHGSPYRKGVASRFSPTSEGIKVNGSWSTDKITGSGYISLLANLLRLNNISSEGHFKKGNSPLAFKVFSKINDKGLWLKNNIYLHSRDIEEILKVKAAFTLGVSFLCDQGNITHDMIKSIFIGGALGEHTSLNDLETLGFFPPGSANKSEIVGNTSLKGALLMAGSQFSREHNIKLASMVESLNLADSKEYMAQSFLDHMVFKYPFLKK